MTQRTEISTLGRAKFIEQLTQPFISTVVTGIGDDTAVIDRGEELELIGNVIFMEGINFDLSYTPLEHLGLKLVTAAVSNCVAMNGVARYITINIGLSARFSVEEAQALYRGIERGAEIYNIELIGGDTAASLTGLTLSATIIGECKREALTLRGGASRGEMLCSTGNLGGAYMGLQLLEREKRANGGDEAARDIFTKYKYILNRQLQPFARIDIIELLSEIGVLPTSMIDITSGLASATLSLCRSSGVGARIHLDRLPLNSEVRTMAEELNTDPIVAILNGGDDFELLFTVPVSAHDSLKGLADINIIGFITEPEIGAALVTPDNEAIMLSSPDFK